jgi:hypothetical protein
MSKSQKPSTFHGLEHWYVAVFEKVGWIILAHSYGEEKVVQQYVDSIHSLIDHIDDKISTIKNEDKLTDLKIMRDNLVILDDHITPYFYSK